MSVYRRPYKHTLIKKIRGFLLKRLASEMEVESDFWKQNEDAGRGSANLGNITDISYISSKRKKKTCSPIQIEVE